jgi:G patch domain/KOW motif-containing protein
MSDQNDEVAKKPSFSFGFSKTSGAKKLIDSKIRDDSTKEKVEEKDIILDVSGKKIKGTKKEEVKVDLIIPCIGNTYKGVQKKEENPAEIKGETVEIPARELTEEEKAAKEIIEESKSWEENQDKDKNPNENLIISVQKNENEPELDEKAIFDAEVEAKPEQSRLEDYEKIPVDGFGMAMLRGMNFKPDEGIGGFRKAKIDCIEPVMRPKGLGLGATRAPTNSNSENKNGESDKKEKLVLKKGAFVQITSGTNKGKYAEVDGLDEQNARVIVRIKKSDSISVSENIIQLVSKRDYEKGKNVLNQADYDLHAEKQKKREKEWENDKKRDRQIFDIDEKDQDSSKISKKSSKILKITWIREGLKVRIIDQDSKYYKEKVLVTNVNENKIECRTDSKKYVDIKAKYLETVIPKESGAYVMIVEGQFRGKIAEMLRKNNDKSKATVRILNDEELVLDLSYDDICQCSSSLVDEYIY